MAQHNLVARLAKLGFDQGKQIKLYGERFQIIREPLVLTEDVAFISVIDGRSGKPRYVRLPLPTLKIAGVRRFLGRPFFVLAKRS